MKRAYNYIRKIETDNGISIDYSELDINFNCKFVEGKNVDQCKVDIFNLSRHSILKLKNSENIRLTAGYTDMSGIILNGQIERIYTVKGSNGDVVTTLECTAGAVSWNDMFISKSWERRVSYEYVARDIINTVGWKVGLLSFLNRKDGTPYRYINGKYFRRPARECLEQIAKDAEMQITFVDGSVYMYPKGYTLNDIVTVSVNDGSLIETPIEQKIKSEKRVYKIKTALRFGYKAGGVIKVLGSKYIDESEYKILEGTHVGSDNSMYTELTIEQVSTTTSPSSNNTDLYGLSQ